MLYINHTDQIIVDGGGNDLLVEKIHEYVPFYDRDIELLVLTHSHLDHYGGLVRLLKEFRIHNIVLPPFPCEPDQLILSFLDTLKDEHATVIDQNELQVGTLKVRIMNNHRTECTVKGENLNNTSIISLFSYGRYEILNMGDFEEEENFNLDKGIDVLKAGHHCSKTSSSENFLKNTNPEIVICSLGENNYGHPSSEVLDTFYNLGIQYFITKEQGDIVLNLSSGLIYNEAGKLIKRL